MAADPGAFAWLSIVFAGLGRIQGARAVTANDPYVDGADAVVKHYQSNKAATIAGVVVAALMALLLAFCAGWSVSKSKLKKRDRAFAQAKQQQQIAPFDANGQAARSQGQHVQGSLQQSSLPPSQQGQRLPHPSQGQPYPPADYGDQHMGSIAVSRPEPTFKSMRNDGPRQTHGQATLMAPTTYSSQLSPAREKASLKPFDQGPRPASSSRSPVAPILQPSARPPHPARSPTPSMGAAPASMETAPAPGNTFQPQVGGFAPPTGQQQPQQSDKMMQLMQLMMMGNMMQQMNGGQRRNSASSDESDEDEGVGGNRALRTKWLNQHGDRKYNQFGHIVAPGAEQRARPGWFD